jgi:Flp pilus assembly pilin Flp
MGAVSPVADEQVTGAPTVAPDPEVCMLDMLKALRRHEDGQTMAEYGVVLTVITIGCLGAMMLLGGNIMNALTRVSAIVGLGS